MERPKLIILFGSQSSGRTHKNSDIDIAVLSNRPLTLGGKMEMTERIAKEYKFDEDKIDLIDLWSAPPLLQHEVAEKGKVLHGTNEEMTHFRVLAWKRYQDTARFRRLREKSLKKTLYV